MFSKNDRMILSLLRQNARTKVTDMSRKTGIPATTIYDKLRVHEDKYIRRHTSLLDFSALDLHARAFCAVNVPKDKRLDFQYKMLQDPNVNSIMRLGHDHDYLLELIFPGLVEMHAWLESIEDEHEAERKQVYHVIDEVASEKFMTEGASVERLEG